MATLKQRTQRYYAKYSVALNERLLNKSDEYIETLAEQYQLALNNITKDIESFYQRFAEDNRLSYADAKRILTTAERQRYQMTLEEYIRKGEQIQYFPDWDLELQNASTVYEVSRLESLEMQIRQQVEELYVKHNNNMKDLMKQSYTEGYYRNIFEVQKAAGHADPFAALNVNKVEAVVTRPWAPDGTNFSEKIWQDRNKMVEYINRELTQSLIRGEGPDRLIKEISKKFANDDIDQGQAIKNAARLVQTEMAYFSTMSKLESYKQMGYNKFINIAVMDKKTSLICESMDGWVEYVENLAVGKNAPPYHPNCRTTIAPYMDDGGEKERLIRTLDGDYTIPKDMTFSEWREKYVDKSGDSASTAEETNDNRLTRGLSNDTIGYTDGNTTITGIKQIDFNDEKVIKKEIDRFIQDFAYADVEHALVISPLGNAYSLKGSKATVNPTILNEDVLRGSIVIHNHPVYSGDMDDSFSIYDLYFSANYQIRRSYLVSGKRKDAFEFTTQYTESEIWTAWREAYYRSLEQAKRENIKINFEHEQILKILSELLEGFVFYENI